MYTNLMHQFRYIVNVKQVEFNNLILLGKVYVPDCWDSKFKSDLDILTITLTLIYLDQDILQMEQSSNL